MAALERRLGQRPADARGLTPGAGRIGRALQRARPGRDLPATRQTSLRALVVGLVARGAIRALALLVRLFGRSLVSGPVRRLVRLLARRAGRARPTHQAGLLALILTALGLAARILTRRLTILSESRRATILLALRLARIGLPGLRRLLARGLRALAGLVGRRVRQAAAARRSAHPARSPSVRSSAIHSRTSPATPAAARSSSTATPAITSSSERPPSHSSQTRAPSSSSR